MNKGINRQPAASELRFGHGATLSGMAGGRSLCLIAAVCATIGLLLSFISGDSGPAVEPLHWRPLPLQPLPSSTEVGDAAARGGGSGVAVGRGSGLVGVGGDGDYTTFAPEEKSSPAPLVNQPLPTCSVVFFHHLEKTGGTTVRSIFQRAAQLGEYDLFSFVNRFDKFQMQMIYHRLWQAMRTPGGLTNLRLAVEIHIGGARRTLRGFTTIYLSL